MALDGVYDLEASFQNHETSWTILLQETFNLVGYFSDLSISDLKPILSKEILISIDRRVYTCFYISLFNSHQT